MFAITIWLRFASFLTKRGTHTIANKIFDQVKTILDFIILAILIKGDTVRILNLRLGCRCRGGLHGDIIP